LEEILSVKAGQKFARKLFRPKWSFIKSVPVLPAEGGEGGGLPGLHVDAGKVELGGQVVDQHLAQEVAVSHGHAACGHLQNIDLTIARGKCYHDDNFFLAITKWL
jgi:hypothetical protein